MAVYLKEKIPLCGVKIIFNMVAFNFKESLFHQYVIVSSLKEYFSKEKSPKESYLLETLQSDVNQ